MSKTNGKHRRISTRGLLNQLNGSEKPRVEVKALTSTTIDGRRNLRAICASIKRHLATLPHRVSIDTLLTYPVDAMRMGLFVAKEVGHITSEEAHAAEAKLAASAFPAAAVLDEINRVCRDAMNCRKRGMFTTGPLVKKERSTNGKSK